MGVEIGFSVIDWNQALKLVADEAPVSQWLDENEDELAFGDHYYLGTMRENGSFNSLYEAMRGELSDDQREVTDRFYAMMSWFEAETANITPVPSDLQVQNFDLQWKADVPFVFEQASGTFSPESVKKTLEYGAKIDFENLKRLIDSIYPDPSSWRTNDGQAELAVKNWKHQEALESFHRFNCFRNADEAFDFSKAWFNALTKASDKNFGFLFCMS